MIFSDVERSWDQKVWEQWYYCIWLRLIFPCHMLVLSRFSNVLTLFDPTDCSPPGSSVHGILQARILVWVAMPSSWGSSWPQRSNPCLLQLLNCRQVLDHWATGEALPCHIRFYILSMKLPYQMVLPPGALLVSMPLF